MQKVIFAKVQQKVCKSTNRKSSKIKVHKKFTKSAKNVQKWTKCIQKVWEHYEMYKYWTSGGGPPPPRFRNKYTFRILFTLFAPFVCTFELVLNFLCTLIFLDFWSVLFHIVLHFCEKCLLDFFRIVFALWINFEISLLQGLGFLKSRRRWDSSVQRNVFMPFLFEAQKFAGPTAQRRLRPSLRCIGCSTYLLFFYIGCSTYVDMYVYT